MNVQKLAVTGATVALLLGSAAGAFATQRHHNNRGTSVDVDVTNSSTLTNTVNTKANTGYNEIEAESYSGLQLLSRGHSHRNSGPSVRGSNINTGGAWASATVLNDVNNTSIDLCGCLSNLRRGSRVDVDVTNTSSLTNDVTTRANSGHNEISAEGKSASVRDSGITSGDAGAEAGVTNWVNTNTLGGSSN
jgi:hypothetical protein